MKLKIFQGICVIIFFLSFGYFFGDQYWNFHEWQEWKKVFEEKIYQENQNFTLESLSSEIQEIELWTTPSVELLEKLVREIDAATKEIFVEVYIFTERDLRDALIRAHDRWVDVKILLENNPYKATYLNDKHYESFQAAGVNVRWSDPLNFSLNHSKLLIIDERAYIGTWNFSYATFTKNRDMFIELREKEIIKKLKQLFTFDFNHELSGVFDERLVVSPYSSRWKLQWLIKNAETTLDFYFPYMTDDGLEEVFSQQVERGIVLRWIVWSDYIKENPATIESLKTVGWNISSLKSPKLHAKAILVDKKYLYIWSINFSTYSLDENREIGIIITNQKIISQFQSIFESDFLIGKE